MPPTYVPSATFGFLEEARRQVLPDGEAWDALRPLAERLIEPSCPRTFREILDTLEKTRGEEVARATETAVEHLSDTEVAHVNSTLTLLAQKYIYGIPGELRDNVPRCIGRPWIAASRRRGSQMTLTYDSVILSNWYLRDPAKPPTIDNVDAYLAVNGSEPERAFLRVHVAIEAAGGDMPFQMLSLGSEIYGIQDEAKRLEALNGFLATAHQRLQLMTHLIGQMWRLLKHEDYWKIVRVTLVGTPEEVFPDGVKVDGTDVVLNRKGGSGAQSPLMHAVDRFFAIDHADPGMPQASLTHRQAIALRTLQGPPEHARRFIEEQKTFMCEAHREFHERLHRVPTARDLVLEHGDDRSVELYNACVGELERWRKVHQQMTHKYIAERVEEMLANPADEDQTGGGAHIVGTTKGTQSSDFKPLLAQLIHETHVARLPTPPTTTSSSDSSPSTDAPPAHSPADGGSGSGCAVM